MRLQPAAGERGGWQRRARFGTGGSSCGSPSLPSAPPREFRARSTDAGTASSPEAEAPFSRRLAESDRDAAGTGGRREAESKPGAAASAVNSFFLLRPIPLCRAASVFHLPPQTPGSCSCSLPLPPHACCALSPPPPPSLCSPFMQPQVSPKPASL